MRRALVILLFWVTVWGPDPVVSADRDDPLRHSSIEEVILMVDGGVAYDVIVERVRRLRAVPALDTRAIASLASKGVPDKVLHELVRKKEDLDGCPELPERKVEVQRVLRHPTIQEAIRAMDAGISDDAIAARIRYLRAVPALDARAIVKLTSKGMPDEVLLELVRKQPAGPSDCDTIRAQILAAAAEVADSKSGHRDDPLRHPSIGEVILMVKGGVAYDVIVERVRRLPAVPALDTRAIAALTSKGVPDEVLIELVRRNAAAADCATGGARKVEVQRAFRHPSIQEVLRMLEAGVSDLERVRRLQDVPALDARAIARLTSKGVPDEVLLELVRKQAVPSACPAEVPKVIASKATAPAAGPNPREEDVPRSSSRRHRRRAPAAGANGLGRIRVIAKSSLPVTYIEVLLDGTAVTRKGEVHRGETKPGWMLPRPRVLDVKGGAVVYESELPPGRYEIQTAFAVSQIVKTDWDSKLEAYGQRYDTATAGPTGEDGQVSMCELREGRTCTVHARLHRRGGRYAVTYDSELQ